MDYNKPGILDIPIEILEEIFTKLDATDILSCTKVCIQFCLATKKNKIWQPLCRRFCERSTYIIDYVNTVPSTVKPVYSPHQEVQASVSEWRRVYMRLIQLKRNFINGVYKIQFVTDYPLHTRQRVRIFQDFIMIYKTDPDNKVEVWNVRNEPHLVGKFVCALRDREPNLYMVGDNIAVVVQGSVLQGFKINVESGDITRMYRRLVYGDNNSDIPDTEYIDRWYRRPQRRPEYISSCVTGEYFVGIVRLADQFMLYQWNVKTGQKVYELSVPKSYSVFIVSPETYSGDILVVLLSETRNIISSAIYRYNLEAHLIQDLFLVHTNYDPAIHYEYNKIVFLDVDRFCNEITLYKLPTNYTGCNVNLPEKISFYFREYVLVTYLCMYRNIVSYILGQTLIVKDNNLNDIYYVSLLENIIPTYRLCDWNILLVSLPSLSQEMSVIELHDIIAKSCIKTIDVNGLVLDNCFPENLISLHYIDDQSYLKLLQFW